MNILNIASKTGHILAAPKQVTNILLGQIRFAILVETIMQWRRGQLTSYFELIPPIMITILLFLPTNYIQKDTMRDWEAVIKMLPQEKRLEIHHSFTSIKNFGLVCYLCGILPAIYFDMPYIVYSIFAVTNIVGIYGAAVGDRIMWRITMGNKIDINIAWKLFSYYHNLANEIYHKTHFALNLDENILDIRYYLCDALRSRNASLGFIDCLLSKHPNYIHMVDRDGSTTSFQLACRYASIDIIQSMLELDQNLISKYDEKGNTPLHWTCRQWKHHNIEGVNYPNPGRLEVVNYLLEKQMSLVTVANKDGDLPIHLASDKLNVFLGMEWREAECTEIVWRLLLAYPECLDCVGGSTVINSNETDIENKKNI